MTETETTTMMMTVTTTTTVTTAANWVKKFSCLNRVSKKIRIRIRIKSIYNETTHFFDMHLIKKKINEQKAATNKLRLQSVYNRFFVVQWVHKTYSVICTHNSFTFTQQSHLNRIVCSALRTVCAVFFDLIFFFCTYQERSFFFFFSIDFKKITICNADMNLAEQQKSDSDNKANTATAARKEI